MQHFIEIADGMLSFLSYITFLGYLEMGISSLILNGLVLLHPSNSEVLPNEMLFCFLSIRNNHH